jgi:hypothetical protein
MDMPAIKERLQAESATWEWLEVSEQFAKVADGYQPTPQRAQKATKPRPAANVTEGEQRVWNGIQGAIRADKSKRAIVRNVWSRRKTKVTDNA